MKEKARGRIITLIVKQKEFQGRSMILYTNINIYIMMII